MFGFFKKTRWEITGKSLIFFARVFESLPEQYSFLLHGLKKGLYRSYAVNHSYKPDNYYIGFDPAQSDKSMIVGKSFEIERIMVHIQGNSIPMQISVHNGLWIGFELACDVSKTDKYHIDATSIRQTTVRSVSPKIQKLVKGLQCSQLDLTSLADIEFEGKTFYQIRDLDDGNYLVIDEAGVVYELTHDPYEITFVHKNIREYVTGINNASA